MEAQVGLPHQRSCGRHTLREMDGRQEGWIRGISRERRAKKGLVRSVLKAVEEFPPMEWPIGREKRDGNEDAGG